MLEKFYAKTARKVRGTNVKVGQPLWAIRKGLLYFIWCYSDEAFARRMDEKLNGPENAADESANWRKALSELTPSDRTSFR